MKKLSYKIKILCGISALILLMAIVISCKLELLDAHNNLELKSKLSDYRIFQGNMADLVPANGFLLYEIPTQLFSDYAEKQRLIKVPDGTKIIAHNDGLPDFPDGTILVKTFYYFNDKRDPSKGKRLVETRVLIKFGSTWNVGTYVWDTAQQEAVLLTTGLDENITWVNQAGVRKAISFHIPSNRECATCHNSNSEVKPLGIKIRNLNINVMRGGVNVNQLFHFQQQGILDPMNPTAFGSLPDWQDQSISLSQRARAYLDVNCAHCHNPGGFARRTHIYFPYEASFHDTKIGYIREGIPSVMAEGKMPLIGTTIVDEEGLALIRAYIRSL